MEACSFVLMYVELQNARPSVTPSSAPQAPNQQPQQPFSQTPQQTQQAQQQRFPQQPPPGQGPPRFQQHNHFPQYYPPPKQRFGPPGGPQGFPPYGYPPMPYGSPPPGWYPPPGQGFPYPNPGNVYGPPGQFGPPGQPPIQQGPPSKPETPAEAPHNASEAAAPPTEAIVDKPAATVKLPSSATTPAPPATAQGGPPPPTESKPNVNEALAPPAPTATKETPTTFTSAAAKAAPAVPKSGRIMPAIPLASPAPKPKAPVNGASKSNAGNVPATAVAPATLDAQRPIQAPTKSIEDANRDARAAVAAAMVKLPPAPGQQKKQTNGESVAFDNLTNKVNEMRTNDNIQSSRQPGTRGYAAGHRGGRGNHRNLRPREDQQTKKMEVPKTDYDFAEANAKFNKQDLVKEAIAGDQVGSPVEGSNEASAEASSNGARRESEQSVTIPAAPGYSKSSSFFDNISSESKDRDDKRLGGREFRSEEQKKNLETFGQGSVDNGYRGGYRGRGRGRDRYGGGNRGGYVSRGRRGGTTRGRGTLTDEV